MTRFPRNRKTFTCESCNEKKPSTSYPTVGTDQRVGECRACRDQRTAADAKAS
jgi:transcription elongation factor Elf1